MSECRVIIDATSTGHHSMRLDERCWQCDGIGKWPSGGTEVSCDICHGAGYTLTDNGDAVMRLVRRHLNDDPD